MSFETFFERGRGRRRGRRVRGVTSVVEEDVRWSVAGRTASSGFNAFVHAGFLQLLQKRLFLCGCVAQATSRCLERYEKKASKTRSRSVRRRMRRGSWRSRLRGMFFFQG